MTTWFVSRHPGALDWMQCYGVMFDCHVAHLCLSAQGRGRELSAEEMQIYDANLEYYDLRMSP